MYAKHPDIARRWSKEGKGNVDKQTHGTVSNNAPVGTAGNPAKTDASSIAAFKGRGKPMDKNRSAAIERRMKNLQKGKK